MKVSEKQLLIMLRALEGSLSISERSDMNLFGYPHEVRQKILNAIINQQSDELVEVKDGFDAK